MCEIVAVRGSDASYDVMTRLDGLAHKRGGAVAIAELGGDRALSEPHRVPASSAVIVGARSERSEPASRLSIGQLLSLDQESAPRRGWPLMDCTGSIVVVHCGAIDNSLELRASLEQAGHKFSSSGDSEVIPHAIEEALSRESTPFEAFQTATARLSGSWAISALIARNNSIFVARHLARLTVRGTVGRFVVATDPAATEGVRGPLRFLENGCIAELGTTWHWAGSPGRPPAPVTPVSRGSRGRGATTRQRYQDPLRQH